MAAASAAPQPVVEASNDGFPTRLSPDPTLATMTAAEAAPVPPRLSVTSTMAVQFPSAYVCVAVEDDCGPTIVPSPKSNRYEATLPSGSLDAEASAVTLSGALPVDGKITSDAAGG